MSGPTVSVELDASVGRGESRRAVTLVVGRARAGGTGLALRLGERTFELRWLTAADGEPAGYAGRFHDDVPQPIDLAGLLRDLLPSDAAVPVSLGSLRIADIGLAVLTERDTSALVARVRFGFEIDFREFPLLGEHLPAGDYRLSDVGLMFSTGALGAADVALLSDALELGERSTLPAGLSATAALRMGARLPALVMDTPAGEEESGDAPEQGDEAAPAVPAATASAEAGPVRWFDVNRQLGPVRLARVGFRYAAGALALPLDVDLQAGPVTLALRGAAVGARLLPATKDGGRTALERIRPTFALDGLGIAVRDPPLQISGAFLRSGPGIAFQGALTIRASEFSLAAMGAFEQPPGQPASFFVFGVLHQELGGPPFFRVTAIAAGLGLNRGFRTGPIESVASHPLIAFATAPADKPAMALLDEARPRLDPYLPAAPGAFWFSAGVRGSTFGLVDSFLMLSVAIDHEISISLLGLSRLTLPRPIPGKTFRPLARVGLQIRAEYLVSAGSLQVEAMIEKGAYVLDPDCHVGGQFAFYAWFKGAHAGDFALTLGGWHPDFHPPAHYPSVDRVVLDWPVTPALNIHGELYFGLTPSCVMAGGGLSASYVDGGLSAGFEMRANFLLSWEPLHYSADLYIALHATYTLEIDWGPFGVSRTPFSLSVSVLARLWGPPFGATLEVTWTVFSFTIDVGTPRDPQATLPIDWAETRERFLPGARADWHTLSATRGLRALVETDGRKHPLLTTHDVVLELRSVLPATTLRCGDGDPVVSRPANLGIRPMARDGYDSTLTVDVLAADGRGPAKTAHFDVAPLHATVPAALWGAGAAPARPSAEVVRDTLVGVRLTLRPVVVAARLPAVALTRYKEERLDVDIAWWASPGPIDAAAGVPSGASVGTLSALTRDSAPMGLGMAVIAAAADAGRDDLDGCTDAPAFAAGVDVLAACIDQAFQTRPRLTATGVRVVANDGVT